MSALCLRMILSENRQPLFRITREGHLAAMAVAENANSMR